ncbi:MAG: SDR family oxidoreductase [Patescibacteria group bacterium]|nr:SDR family oxidoreductase [Patescibacteria group bacterium]
MFFSNKNNSTINNLLDLSGKTAIVTGGAVGIGLGVVSNLAQAGAKVVIADRSAEDAQKAVAELSKKGFKVKVVTTDVSSEQDVKNLVEETVKVFSSVDILVNNAGIYPNIPLIQLTAEDFEKVIAVNLKGVFLTVKYVSGQMIKQGKGGKIINISSIDALHPSMIGLAAYDASKHGVWGFTKNVALELAQYKIWVNAIAPGGIATPGVAKLQAAAPATSTVDPKKMIEAFLAKIPMRRMGEPDEIGKVALFLASDMSSYMTGSQIVVDGGALLS